MHCLKTSRIMHVSYSSYLMQKQFLLLLSKSADEPGIPALPKLVAEGDVGLIIVDSIAGLFRAFGVPRPDYKKRKLVLEEVGMLLHSYCDIHVVVINEVGMML